MTYLVECAACRRHVRSNESECPFCGASVAERACSSSSGSCVAEEPTARPTAQRLSRAAMAAVAASIVGTACSVGRAEPLYGISVGPGYEGGTTASGGTGGTTPIYGISPGGMTGGAGLGGGAGTKGAGGTGGGADDAGGAGNGGEGGGA